MLGLECLEDRGAVERWEGAHALVVGIHRRDRRLAVGLEKLDPDLHEAAADLGARRHRVFLDVTLPLAMPGIIAGCLLVFIPALGEYVIPALLGGLDTLMIGRTLYDEFFVNRDWPLASAVAVVLLLILILPIMLFQRLSQESET